MLRGRLGASLPHYMVPAAFHWREALPLTAERQDRHQGAGRARGATSTPPRTRAASRRRRRPSSGSPPRTRPCSAFRSDEIGRHDHFFDRGGTSLSAVKLAVAMERRISLKDVTRHPVLADLAELVDSRPQSLRPR